MNNQSKYRISAIEMSVTLMSMLIGVGILTLPRALAEEIKLADGWISIIIGGLLTMLLVYLSVQLQKNFPGQTVLQFISKGKYGRWISYFLSGLFFLYFINLVGFEVRILVSIISMYILDQTPSEIFAALILLLTTYAVSKGTQGIVHLNILFMPIVLFVLIGVIIFPVFDADFTNLLPIMPKGIMPVLSATKLSIVSFLGIEILMFFMASMKQSELRAMPLNFGILIVMLLYLSVTIISYSVFSVDETIRLTFPTLELAKEVKVPGGFLERLESVVITVWILSIFNTMSIAQLIATKIVTTTFPKLNKGGYIPIILIFFIYIISFVPNSVTETFVFGGWIGWFGLFTFTTSLICGYLSLWARKRKKGVGEGVIQS